MRRLKSTRRYSKVLIHAKLTLIVKDNSIGTHLKITNSIHYPKECLFISIFHKICVNHSCLIIPINFIIRIEGDLLHFTRVIRSMSFETLSSCLLLLWTMEVANRETAVLSPFWGKYVGVFRIVKKEMSMLPALMHTFDVSEDYP